MRTRMVRRCFLKYFAIDKAKATRLMNCYKLTPERWQQVYSYQNGACPICCREFEKPPHTDHRHEDGLFRGLLCHQCNVWIGKIENSFKRMGLHKVGNGFDIIEGLEFALRYLTFPTATPALGAEHYGYTGGVNTKEHRKRLRKERKAQQSKG